MLYEPDQVISHVHFPTAAVVSLLVLAEHGVSVDATLVGHDGLVGLPVALGLDRDTNRAIVQVAGTAFRVGAPAFRSALARAHALHDVVQRYTQMVLTQTAQTAACNGLHPAYGRCARWLLEIHDRGLIGYHRGQVTILDRERLEGAACECCRVVADAGKRLFRPSGRA